MPEPEKIIHKELSYRVNGCIFDVHNEVGPGVREECYQKAMELRLCEVGIHFIAKPQTRTEFRYRDVVVAAFEPDLLLPGWMVLELKHQPDGLARDNFRQILNYVKYWDLRLGLLINFAMESAIIERVPNERRPIETVENYDYFRDRVTDAHRPILRTIREGLFELRDRVGTGYSDSVCRNLAIVEFQFRGLTCDANVEVAPEFHDQALPRSPISPLLVNNSVCVQIEAVRDDITARARRTMQTHLRLTGCGLGLIVLFGKTKFVIQGVRR